MKQFLFFLIVAAHASLSFSQTQEEVRAALEGVNSLEDLEAFKEDHSDWTVFSRKVMSLGSTYDSTIFHAEVDSVVSTRTNENSPIILHKIIAKGTEEACKVQYIYLDGKRRSMGEMNVLRSRIIDAYKNGTPFIQLVRKYSEDGNATGTLDWFYEGMMDATFDMAVRDKPAGSIFTVDVPLRYWYYVVLKSEENRKLPTTYTISVRVNR
ncbi:MAG: peptidyl-prolyl cis-trans isomerase [bacterium]|nr:peptidyl-prolyl cis-trans isomerase [bacterium]